MPADDQGKHTVGGITGVSHGGVVRAAFQALPRLAQRQALPIVLANQRAMQVGYEETAAKRELYSDPFVALTPDAAV